MVLPILIGAGVIGLLLGVEYLFQRNMDNENANVEIIRKTNADKQVIEVEIAALKEEKNKLGTDAGVSKELIDEHKKKIEAQETLLKEKQDKLDKLQQMQDEIA